MQDGSVSVTGVMASSNALHYCVCLLPGPGRQDGHGRIPAPKRHRGGACCRGLSLRQWMSWLRMRLQKCYAAMAARAAGWTAARAEWSKRTRFRQDAPDHAAFRFAPFAVELCGYIGKEARDTWGHRSRAWAHYQGCIRALANAAAVGDGAAGVRCVAGVGWSSRVSRACVMMLVLQCQC